MKHQFEITPVDYNDIEARARQMRAEVVRDQAKAFGSWLRDAFQAPAAIRRGNA